MRIIAKSTLRKFWRRHPNAEKPLLAWYRQVERAAWSNSAELKSQYANASIINKEKVVFNIRGNTFRLVAEINYAAGVVYIRFVGTHDEYDAVDARTVRHGRRETRSKRARLRNRP